MGPMGPFFADNGMWGFLSIDNNVSATRPPIVCEGTKINGATAEYIQKILERAPTFSRTASHRDDPSESPPKSLH